MKVVKNRIAYEINRNIELMSVVMLLSDKYYKQIPYLKSNEYFYTNEVRKYFMSFAKHNAIIEFERKFQEEGFCFDKPFKYAISPQDRTFSEALISFSNESKFDNFLNSKKDYFDSAVNLSLEKIANYDYVQMLCEYFHSEPSIFRIYFSPTVGSCGFQISNEAENCCVLGCFGVENNIPLFIQPYYFNEMVIHEFTHGYVNHLVEKQHFNYKQILAIYNFLRNDIKPMYGCTKGMIAEQVVRAITIRIIGMKINKEQAVDLLKRDESYGLVLVPMLCSLLETKYENSELTFESFVDHTVEFIEPLIEANEHTS